MNTLLVSLELCTFCLILLSRKSAAFDYRYEACVPKNCGNGPNITFPFYIQDLHESYCGYPGFQINCRSHGYPTINLPENDYLVENISYLTRSFRVYNDAFSSISNRRCLPQIGNTTLPIREFNYVDETRLYLFSNCTRPLSKDLSRYEIVCRDNWDLAIWNTDENLVKGLQMCEKNVVAPVEVHGNEERNGIGNYLEILRRGFMLNWTASDCSICEESGGRCGFNTSTYHFKCFCPDRPHLWSCKPGKLYIWQP
ncbi:putative serine/threonine-protein kinase [Abeliophyllum distichum]|uniref:non-specific serine/threonine protein kinase n=1 Tax=Abeliophyllum distichum TaxID=126358 RepID=A0ABD1RAM7_9LAMI